MPIDPRNFKAPFIPAQECWNRADEFREEHWQSGDFPVDVLAIAECSLGLEIRVIDGLKYDEDVDALLTLDWQALAVDRDQYMEGRFQSRMRYSVAHELGHYVLHREVAKQLPKTAEELLNFYQLIPEKEYSFLEYHANEFAGALLVPRTQLAERLRIRGVDPTNAEEGQRVEIIGVLSAEFAVSRDVIDIRLSREKLWPAKTAG